VRLPVRPFKICGSCLSTSTLSASRKPGIRRLYLSNKVSKRLPVSTLQKRIVRPFLGDRGCRTMPR
jgi:hypothetical protein